MSTHKQKNNNNIFYSFFVLNIANIYIIMNLIIIKKGIQK